MPGDAGHALFPPPQDAARFYRGVVMHHRMRPKPHRFRYGVFSLLIDLTRLAEADRLSPLFSVGRFNLLGFDPRDHGPMGRQGAPLETAQHLLAEAGIEAKPARVLLLCYPRVLGFVFNPLATYFAYDGQDQLIGVIHEVRNTFAERHCYVMPVHPGSLSPAGLRQEADKLFYVSPFIGLGCRYHFRVLPPGDEQVAIRIHETDGEGPLLAATFHGTGEAITTLNCLRLAFRMPLLTLKVVAAINIEALRLWLKGIKLVSKPKPPPAASLDGLFLAGSSGPARDSSPGGNRDHG